MKVIREHNIDVDLNETDLSINFKATNSMIYLSGAKDKSEIEKFRGLALKLVYIDEAQSFRSYLSELINDVIAPALFDYNGRLCMIGTPGPVPVGFYYEASQSHEWANHGWTLHVNPHIKAKSGKEVDDLIREELKRKGVDLNDPGVQREFFGKWVVDKNALIFKYDKGKNDFAKLPDLLKGWEFVIGVDIGHDDSDAICVLGWNPKIREIYLFEEDVQDKQGITELADKIKAYITKYNPLKVVMDTGGLGKKIAEEIRKRHEIPIAAAEKSRKMEFVELLNDAMRTGVFKAKKESAFAQDCFLIEKDFEKSTPDKIVVSDKYHSDIADSVLYAYREALHWLHTPEPPKKKPGTPEYYEEIEDELEQETERQILKTDDIWGDMGEWNMAA